MNRYYTKDGKRWFGDSIIVDDRRVFNPTEEQLIAAGYEPHDVEPYMPTLEEVKVRKIAEIDAYDTSDAVNSFVLNGASVWLDWEMRQRARTKIEATQKAGKPNVTLWFGTVHFELPCELATQLIWLVEDYAGDCYDVTASHKAAIDAMTDKEAVEGYDFTKGYPDKLEICTDK